MRVINYEQNLIFREGYQNENFLLKKIQQFWGEAGTKEECLLFCGKIDLHNLVSAE